MKKTNQSKLKILMVFILILIVLYIFSKNNSKKEMIEFERYMMAIQDEYDAVTVPFYQKGGSVQGAIEGKGMIDWKAPMSIIQFLNQDLPFKKKEKELLEKFKNANLLQITKDDTYILEKSDESEMEEEKKERYLIVEISDIDGYVEWCNNNFDVINQYKEEKKLEYDSAQTSFTEEEIIQIKEIYDNYDFFQVFSEEFNTRYAYRNVKIEDERIKAIYNEFLKNAGARYYLSHDNLNYDNCMDYYDCSSWVLHVWGHLGIKKLGNMNASDLSTYYCEFVAVEDRKPGDLIFLMGTYNSANIISHVGIYMGELTINGETAEWVIDTGGNPKGVKIGKYDNGFWNGKRFYAFGRAEY